ncbi:MAG: hypothetical protein Q8867_06340 [Bacteroidota bacterium]|nr:hypothetical protein [Bacteroidota bacterium]
MNSVQLHLIFTHLPIIGLGLAFLFNLVALIRKSEELQKLTFWFYILVGIFALLAYFTGDDAEKIMLTYPGITEDIIEPHESIALFFLIGLMITAVLSVFALFVLRTKKNLLKRFNIILLVIAFLLCALAVRTGATGGEIRHTEIEQGIYRK